MGHDPVRLEGEILKDLVLCRSEVHFLSLEEHFSMEQIDNEVAKGKHRFGLRPRGVPESNPHAREDSPC